MKRFATALLAVLLATTIAAAEFVTTANPVHTSGVRATIDLPGDQHMKNIGSHVDGYGMCVSTSNEVAARWQNIPELYGIRDYLAKKPGGSWPELYAADIKEYCSKRGVTVPLHIQHTGGDIEFLRLGVKTRRMLSITYAGLDNFYGNNTVSHMVNLAHLDGKLGAVIDNNEATRWRWMSDQELVNRWLGRRDNGAKTRVGGGWLVVYLGPPPPPIDTTAPSYLPEASEPIVSEEADQDTLIPENPIRKAALEVRGGVYQTAEEKMFPEGGVNLNALQERCRYWVNGQEVLRPEAFAVLEAATLTDDSNKLYVTVVEDDAAKVKALRDAFVSDPTLAKFAPQIHFNVFKSGHWATKRLGGNLDVRKSAKDGGKVVYFARVATVDEVVKGVKIAFNVNDPPPTPPMPVPTPPVLPDDKPAKPDDATPSAPSRSPWWWLVILGGVVALLLWKKV